MVKTCTPRNERANTERKKEITGNNCEMTLIMREGTFKREGKAMKYALTDMKERTQRETEKMEQL